MQNLIDYSLQKYGTPAAVFLIIEDNPQLFAGDRELEITAGSTSSPTDFDELVIRAENNLLNKKLLKELDGKIIVSE